MKSGGKSKMGLGKVCCFLLLALTLSEVTYGQEPTSTRDVVIFINGDRLTGSLSSASEANITLITEFGVPISIPREKVKEIQRAQNSSLETKGQISSGKSHTSLSPEISSIQTATGVAVSSAGGNTKIIQADVTASLKTPLSPVRWFISIEPQASLTTGAQKQQVLGGQLILNRVLNQGTNNWREQTTRLILGANNTVIEKPGTSPVHLHVYDGTFTHQFKLTEYLSAFGIAEAYHNSALRLYLQQSYGGGLGVRKIFGQEKHVVELSSDVRYIAQHFYSNTPADTFAGARFGQGYTIRLFPTPAGFVELFEKMNYIHPFNMDNAWQIRGTAGIDVPINSSFALRVQYTDDYFQNAPNGRKNYSKTTLGIKYTFIRPIN